MTKQKIYISGPMTGIPEYNRPEFNRVAQELEAKGYDVINPASLPDGFEYVDYIFIAKISILKCDAMYLLKNWEDSEGAKIEIIHYLTICENPCIIKQT